VLADGAGVSRIFLSLVAPQDRQWMRTAMPRRVRPRWRRSPRAGGANSLGRMDIAVGCSLWPTLRNGF
jgi:hypothetical protein